MKKNQENPPPRPAPRGGNQRSASHTSSVSSSDGLPPKYTPSIPHPIISGYLDKGSGDANPRNQVWAKKYIEVVDGNLKFFKSREDRESCVVVPLFDSFVSVQDKRYIRLESREGVRLFRAGTETRALTWVFVISRYCFVAPTSEGLCEKLSGGKNVLEERYLRLTADGILSWYKSESDESSPRGSIQVRGERIFIDPDDRRALYVQTQERRYLFKFLDDTEANQWHTAVGWHSRREKLIGGNVPSSLRN